MTVPSRPHEQEPLEALQFPVLCFSQNLVLVVSSQEELTTTNKAALRNGFFANLLLVGSNSVGAQVKGARKLHGIGPFGGFNLFLNQRIRVALEFAGPPFAVELDDVKQRVQASFRNWHGWFSRGDFEELQARLERAQSVAEIVSLLDEDAARRPSSGPA